MKGLAAYGRMYACLLLTILLSAQIGHKIHIFREEPVHFAALCGDLLPDNGAREKVVELCYVDDYCFFTCLAWSLPPLAACSSCATVVRTVAPRCRCIAPPACISLRAPPVC